MLIVGEKISLVYHQIPYVLKCFSSMLTIQELLRDAGLSEKEARMYVTLLRYGMQPIGVLAKKAEMNRGTAYVVLHALLTKGLATKSTKENVQHFAPLDPTHILRFLEHQQQEFMRKREKVQAMMGELLSITNPHTAQPKIEFFEGVEGARAVLDDTLTAKESLLRAFLSVADAIEFTGADFFYDYTMRRIKAGHTLHAIRTLEKDKEAIARDVRARRYMTNRKERREIRYVSEELAFPITMYLYDNKIAIVSSKEENFAVIIQSNELAEMQKKLFELVWQSLKRKQS